ECDADVLLGDLLGTERAVGPPPGRKGRAHGDDCAGGRAWVVGAEESLAHSVLDLLVDHALLDGAELGDLLSVRDLEAAHLAGTDKSQLAAVRVIEDEV